jgi:hypothetical protein
MNIATFLQFQFIAGMNESNLVVQVRTTRVGDVNATGFTGIAVKEGNTETIQVNLLSTGKYDNIPFAKHLNPSGTAPPPPPHHQMFVRV